MKKYIKYMLYGLFALSVFTACVDDEGNYDYEEIGELKIDTIGLPYISLYNVEFGQHIQIKPNIHYHKPSDKLEYYWIVYPFNYDEIQDGNAMVFPKADTISREHELNWNVDLESGSWTLQFVALDPENGVRTFFNFVQLSVLEAGVKSGLYILSEYEGKTDIDLYGTARALIIGGDHFTPKYYSSIYGEMMSGEPLFISYGNDYYYAFTDEEALRLNRNGLRQMDDFSTMFYNAPVYNPQTMVFANSCEFMLNNGKLHVLYTNQSNDGKFSSPIAGDYNAASFLTGMTRTSNGAVENAIGADQIIFDKDSKAFRPYFPRASSMAQFKSTDPDAIIDANNMPVIPKFILPANGGQTYSIMEIEGVYYLYVTRFYNVVDDGDLSIGGSSITNLSGCKDIALAKYFATSEAGNAFFYATDNGVYSFSYTSGQTNQLDIHTCEAGEIVTCLYLLPSGGFPTAGCVLWIGVWNESAKEGKLVEYEIDPISGAITSQKTNMFAPDLSNPSVTTGFGKIKSMIIKM